MTKSDKILTGLSSILTDKIRSNYIKNIKKKLDMSHGNYQKPELLINSMPENKVSDLSFSEQCEEKGPITFEAKPDPELIIKSVLEHFTYLKFQNSFRGIDNYNFASPQPWSSPCPICDGKHGNYGLYGEWYKNGIEYCLTCFTSSNKFKFAIVA